MSPLRALTLQWLLFNKAAEAKHIPGNFNITDSLSHIRFDKFHRLAPQAEKSQRLFRARFGTYSIYNQRAFEGVFGNKHTKYIQNANSAFNKFRLHHNLGIQWPVAVFHEQYFISSWFERGLSPATISSYCACISFFHKINHHSYPASTFFIQKMLEGCMQSRNQNDNRDPISKEMLNDTCSKLNQICSSHYEMLLFTAAFTLVYLRPKVTLHCVYIYLFRVFMRDIRKLFDFYQTNQLCK